MTDLYIFIFIFLHCCLIPLLSQYCTIGKSKNTYIHTIVESYLNMNLCSQGDLTKVRLYMGDHLIQIAGYITGVSVKGAIVVNLENQKIWRTMKFKTFIIV